MERSKIIAQTQNLMLYLLRTMHAFFPGGTWYTTYTSVPHYITSYHRSLMLESLQPTVFDTTDASTIAIEIDSDVIVGRIISGITYLSSKLAITFILDSMCLIISR